MFEVSIAGAFLGGLLALLSPCSALLLPSFFAYAFKTRRQLLARTALFFLGMCTLFIPLGVGVSLAGAIVLDRRDTAILIAGLLLIVFGLLELFGVGFQLLPARWTSRRITDAAVSVYATGAVYGFAGFCSGPLLGAVLTMAAGAGTAWRGGALLTVYALGMAAPLFVLALLWDRYKLGRRAWLRGKVVQIGRWQAHTSNLISGALFIAIGLLFTLTRGTVGLERAYAALGLAEFSFHAQQWIWRTSGAVPDWVWLIPLAGGLAWIYSRRRRAQGPPDRSRPAGPGA